ncbi:hypothetical protein P3T76_003610 [Phytophthora citrophthora]|uniref:Putative restriction endonuclease domain-containing protein n=1 Tax=Phytophthora citrophthora TaxID=4793 RepID=A0AAD9GUL9_9STRA|nr:hypothetical protein P3T76_003610 [Phytophthora citrophthora]
MLHTEGFVNFEKGGYLFNRPTSSCGRGNRHRFIPDISYIDETTWSQLSYEERNKGFISCVPAVVVVLMTRMDKIEDLQAKVAKFNNAGTHEGVIVDTRADRVWIYNRNQQPYFTALAPIEFDSWPGFTLDCIAIRDARIQEGFE